MNFVISLLLESWRVLEQSAIYVLFGILIGGLLKVFLPPSAVAKHLGQGRFLSVFKSALMGIPMPLCSCGVLPAAATLKRQGANNGATTAFLISTPESGVDSIAVTYALLDPVMTIARPVAAFAAATVAGIAENLASPPEQNRTVPDLSCPVDGCCDGSACPEEVHTHHHSLVQKLRAGLGFAFSQVWSEIATWFMVGLLLAGLITLLIPPETITRFLGGGFSSMLLMLVLGIPLYICATASTPIAAAMILKGVSPGAALVFLLAGPATNITSLTVLLRLLGKRATVIYLTSIAVVAVLAGLVVDALYRGLGLNPIAMIGKASEFIPPWLNTASAILLLALSIKPVYRSIKGLVLRNGHSHDHEGHDHEGHDHLGHDHEGHDHLGHDHLGHDHEGHDHLGHDHLGHDHEGHDHLGHDHLGRKNEAPEHQAHEHLVCDCESTPQNTLTCSHGGGPGPTGST